MNEAHFAITIFILLLLIASGVAMAAKWVRVPYTLMLVIVGLIISPMHFLPAVHISPELILMIFLPALLFEAAWNLKLDHLRENWLPIAILAVPGVVFSVGLIGAALHWAAGLSWSAALLFGAMISATDPVSVLALFKKLGLPQRLTTVVEGESLFNDGTAVVVFKILLGIVMSAGAPSAGELAWGSLREFGVVVLGGLAVGAVAGMVSSTLTSYFDDHLLEISLTTIAAYGSFLLAEGLHVSPVIAVLTTGLIIGNHGRRVGMSPTTQVAVNSFWEYAAFVVNSLVFLLIGLEVQISMLAEHLGTIACAIAAMLGARAIVTYGLVPISNRFSHPLPPRWQHVLFWGGLRGSLSIALVLSLPKAIEARSELISMIFGAVIFSLLGQGLSISPLLRKLGFTRPEPKLREYEVLVGQLSAETAAEAELENLRKRGMVTPDLYQTLRGRLSKSHTDLAGKLAQLDVPERMLEEEQLRRMERRLADVKKSRVAQLVREGMLTEAGFDELNLRFDAEIAEPGSEEGAAAERKTGS